jgi:hypothetical protein
MRILFNLLSVFFLLVPMLQCNSPDIESAWRKNEITINGNPDEWAGSIQYSNGNKLGIGFMNDEKNLFICITSYDRQINSQIIGFGFTFLIKPKNGHGKVFGIRFPCGMDKPGHRPHSPHEMGNNPDMMNDMMNEDFEKSLQTIQIIGPRETDTLPMFMVQAQSAGLTARIRLLPNGSLCYEVKLPLRPDSSGKLAINVGNDSIVTFSCETSVPGGGQKFSGGPPSGPTGGMGGGSGGMGGGPGGGAGGPGGGMGGGPGGGMGGGPGGGMGGGPGGGPPFGETLQQFKAKMSLKLATKAE